VDRVFLKVNVDRPQVVKAFYLGLLTFANSDKFQSKEWEIEYLKERLCKALDIDEETLIQQLTALGRKELGKLLFNAYPTYYVSYPEAANKNEEWNMFLQDTIDKEKGISNEIGRVETPVEWRIPEDYNFWTTNKKRDFVIECINARTNCCEGMKINDFRSTIIEKYLDQS